ncbi:MAG: serine hydrolase [Myxococcota bacterium]
MQRDRSRPTGWVLLALIAATGCGESGTAAEDAGAPDAEAPADAGRDLPLPTQVEVDESHPTPPGADFAASATEYAAAFSAKELCTRVFVAGGDPNDTLRFEVRLLGLAAEGFDIARAAIDIDEAARRVTVEHPDDPPRTAVHAESQGCVILPRGEDALFFEPQTIPWEGPPEDAPWPLGETLVPGESPIDRDGLERAMDAHIARAGMRAMAVVHRGELVAERYAEGYGPRVPQRGWSTGKSVMATAVGRLIDREVLGLDDPAPVAAWQGDSRRDITIRNLVHMSSGLDQTRLFGFDSFFSAENEHGFIYIEGFDTLADAIEVSPGAFAPGTEYSYLNTNVLTVTAVAQLAYQRAGGNPMALFQREVFEPLGMRSSIVEVDPYGHFIVCGAFFTTVRDLARLALAHMDDGMLGGERVLSETWARFAYAPSEGFAGYGAYWRNNLDGRFDLPTDAFFANGGFGQKSVAIPSRDLVVAQMGFDPLTDFENFETFVNDVVAVADAIPEGR